MASDEKQLDSRFIGTFEVYFVGRPVPRVLDIEQYIATYDGTPIVLIDKDGRMFNWSNIFIMKRT